MPKLKIEFDGFDEILDRLKRLDGDVKKITETALSETHAYVTPNIYKAMSKHNDTGDTEDSIKDAPDIKWIGDLASVDVGFDISKGGLPSIFLMYGANAHRVLWWGTPRIHPGIKADKNLYNSVFGSKTSKAIQDIQKKVFYDALRRLE